MSPDSGDSVFSSTLKKVMYFYLNYYTNKYNLNENEILITATFLDCRTKNFGRFNRKKRKEFQKKHV